MESPETISRLSRRWNIPPRKISDRFYSRELDDSRCPIIDGRRIIPAEYVPEIERVLREAGVLRSDPIECC